MEFRVWQAEDGGFPGCQPSWDVGVVS